jgi:hypothetical protein
MPDLHALLAVLQKNLSRQSICIAEQILSVFMPRFFADYNHWQQIVNIGTWKWVAPQIIFA